MLRKFTFLLFLLMVATTIQARHITGKVVDTDHRDLEGATVELLSIADSSVIRVAQTKEVQLWGWKQWVYELDVENNKSYLLRVSMLGYQTQYKKVDVKMADRANEQRVDDIVLAENARQLSEVVVKATKIKMVMKGDTVVYDASAFNLSEGSMLDALVQQMPGATLENGVIKVNGRTISSLLVDGRDFFNGDASKALENLPAPTHAFIGGSTGKLRNIIDCLLAKNPDVRIVANAVTLETVAELTELCKSFEVCDIAEVSVSKPRVLGRYHLMTAQNPVYIFTLQHEIKD